MYDMISIIGAGPVGNYLAYLLAKSGYKVEVYEDHNQIGCPIQCTGIVTSTIKQLMDMNQDFLVNTVSRIRIYSPDNNFIEIKMKDLNYIVDRTKFDSYFAKKAKKLGVKYNLGWKFLDFKNGVMKFNKGEKKTDVLVGADGPNSIVARSSGLYNKQEIVYGLQARLKIKHDPDLVDTFLIEGGFGWVVPENSKICRVGLVSNNPKKYNLKWFTSKFGDKIVDYQSGPIPVFSSSLKTCKDNVYLVGDAAGMVKATTAGGIIQGMMAAEELVKSIKFKKNYNRLWKKRVGRELFVGKLIRNKLDRLSEMDLNELIRLASSEKVKDLLANVDRDYPSRILIGLLFREPRFLKFAFK